MNTPCIFHENRERVVHIFANRRSREEHLLVNKNHLRKNIRKHIYLEVSPKIELQGGNTLNVFSKVNFFFNRFTDDLIRKF